MSRPSNHWHLKTSFTCSEKGQRCDFFLSHLRILILAENHWSNSRPSCLDKVIETWWMQASCPLVTQLIRDRELQDLSSTLDACRMSRSCCEIRHWRIRWELHDLSIWQFLFLIGASHPFAFYCNYVIFGFNSTIILVLLIRLNSPFIFLSLGWIFYESFQCCLYFFGRHTLFTFLFWLPYFSSFQLERFLPPKRCFTMFRPKFGCHSGGSRGWRRYCVLGF